MRKTRDHGGGLDAAVAAHGGLRGDWLDLSTGINPVPYPVDEISSDAWTALPDQGAMDRLLTAARKFWNVPDGAEIIAANGASALIAKVPYLTGDVGGVYIPQPTYNEHAAAIDAARNGIWVSDDPDEAHMHVYVHPNNPTGQLWSEQDIHRPSIAIIDESFCDVTPNRSHIEQADEPGRFVLKSFGKFWGLAGLRLGFVIGATQQHWIAEPYRVSERSTPHWTTKLNELLGPWAASGPALEIGARALEDVAWAEATRIRLAADASRLDDVMIKAGAKVVGGTDLFRLYEVADAEAAQQHLAKGKVWSRIFPYSKTWLRLGLPAPERWGQLEAAVEGLH